MKSSIYIIVILFIGKIIGFIKQLIVGWIFGANQNTDIYFMAEGFIAAINNAIFSAFIVTFLRSYIIEKDSSNPKSTNNLVTNTLVFSNIVALLLVSILIFFSPIISRLLAPKYLPSNNILLKNYIIILSPTIIIWSITSILGGVLDGEKQFLYSKFSGIITSISYIVICLITGERFQIYALIIANLFSNSCYLLFLIYMFEKKIRFKLERPYLDNKVLVILKSSVPIMLGNAVADINAIVDKTIVSSLETGSVSALYYGQIASNDIINGTFIYAIGSILISYFTELIILKKNSVLIQKVQELINSFIILLVPITILYLIFYFDISCLLFGHGVLNIKEVQMISYCILGYSLGFPLLAIREVLVKLHYGYNDMKSPTLNGIITVIINIFLSILFSKRYGVFGVTIASSISIVFAIILLEFSTKTLLGRILLPNLISIIQAVVGGSIAFIITSYLKTFKYDNIYFKVIFCSIIYIFVYITFLFIIKNKTILQFKKNIIQKYTRGK